ncbi:DegT/DnrJ/EryC1/StrS family aminotransferase [Desulfovibrio sp. OttesenSCG-928-I05]|nr:DegT/DnrJ/EryC1/StrS family aminotransferase [Desulfovibrio sp. OttesenSCG-928-I05]
MIPFANPHAAFALRKQEILCAIERSLDSGRYILGEEVAHFESAFAAYLGLRFATGCANGTDAIELALRAAGVGTGDAVFTVSHTAVATAAAIERCGATPALVDIDEASMTMSPASLERTIEHIRTAHPALRPAAVIPVHLYGNVCDMHALLPIARQYGLFVLEDCAQAHGARSADGFAGTFGDAAAFSFYPTKNLGALGDGGACVCKDAGLDDALKALRQYGWKRRYISDVPGINSRLDPVQAAILQVQLRYLEQDIARRRQIAALYDAHLPAGSLVLPTASGSVHHAYHLYVIRTPRRDELMAFLGERGIGSAIHYPEPVHTQPAYARRLCMDPAGLPVTERAARSVLSLPMFPQLPDEDILHVCDIVSAWEDATRGAA